MTIRAILGFVFATSMEADPLITRINAAQIKKHPWSIFHARLSGQPTIIIICGMGMAQAKTATEFLINNYAVNLVINCGVAGSLSDAFDIGDIVNITRSVIFKDDHVLDDVCLLHACSPGTGSYAEGALLTLDQPVFDQDKKNTLTEIAQLVDMEGGVIARTCRQKKIPCQLIKIVSDHSVNRNQLENNLCNVSNKLADCMVIDITCRFRQEMIA